VTSVYLMDVIGRRPDLPVGELIRAARKRDVVAGEFMDEELILLGKDSDAEPDPHWHPHLSTRDQAGRRVALETTVRKLVMVGLLDPGEDGADPAWVPPFSVLTQAMASALAAITWRTAVQDEGTATGAALVLPGGLVLDDDIDEANGGHVLTFRSAERQALHLQIWLDPRGRAKHTRPPIVARTADDLDPRPDDLAARATTTTVLARVARTPDGGVEQALTTYATDEGLWLLQGHRAPESVATLQLVGGDDLAAVTRRLVVDDQDNPRHG